MDLTAGPGRLHIRRHAHALECVPARRGQGLARPLLILCCSDSDPGLFFIWDPKLSADRCRLSPKNGPPIDLVHQNERPWREKSTLAESVYQRIKDEIFEFRMAPGQRYAEQELASRFGVSRTPLRFALHVLAREGYLIRVAGHAGWQVKPLDLAYFEDLYDFRVQIELVALRRLCAADPMPDLRELRAFWCVPVDQRLADGQAVARADEQLHGTLVALAGNQEMKRVHADLTERIRIIRRLDFIEPERIASAYDEHKAILDALVQRRADQAEMLLKAHIAASRAEIRHITLHRLAVATGAGHHSAQG